MCCSSRRKAVIFYTPTDTEGRTVLCGTQADARLINKDFEQIDIPIDKTGLMAFVQKALDTAWTLRKELDELPLASAPEPKGEPLLKTLIDVPAGKTLQQSTQTSWDATQIEDFILHRASVAQVENIFSCLGNKFAEIAKTVTI
jgi:hypothetical protein